MGEIERVMELIAAIYDAALQSSGWASLAVGMADLFDAGECQIHVLDLTSNSLRMIGATPDASDAMVPEFLGKFAERYGSPNDLFSDNSAIHDEFYNIECLDCFEAQQIQSDNFFFITRLLEFVPGELCVIGLRRRPGAASLTSEEKRWLQILLLHLQRALKIQARLSAVPALDRIEFDVLHAVKAPVLLVDEQAHIVFSNQMAESLLAEAEGIRNVAGVLQAADRGVSPRLLALIGAVTSVGHDEAQSSVLAVPRAAGRPLSLMVAPLPRRATPAGVARALALIMVGDPDRRARPALAALVDLYGLTRAEARLLDSLLAGERLQQYAERAGVSINTAKSQLAQLFQKTGHSRQSDLLREIGADPIWTLL